MNHPFRSFMKRGFAETGLLAIAALAFSGGLYAEEGDPDFYLMMKHCEMTVVFLTSSDAEITQLQPEPIHFVCQRSSINNVVCDLKFPAGDTGQKRARIELGVVSDVPPSLLLANKHFADFVAIDSAKHSAVVITRMLENEYAASKVCHGVFVTAYEMEGLLDLEGDTLLHPR